MRTSSVFQPTDAQIDAMVRRHPLAQVVSASATGLLATPLPLLLDRGDASISLMGHFARLNPHVDAIRTDPNALVIFSGPHGYVSPSWLTDRTQAPTWNFATVHMSVRIDLNDDPADARAAVSRLTEFMETGRSAAWQPLELGKRFERLLPHIIPFRAEVLKVTAKFKLGQNERPDVLVETVRGARQSGCIGLAEMMEAANEHRL